MAGGLESAMGAQPTRIRGLWTSLTSLSWLRRGVPRIRWSTMAGGLGSAMGTQPTRIRGLWTSVTSLSRLHRGVTRLGTGAWLEWDWPSLEQGARQAPQRLGKKMERRTTVLKWRSRNEVTPLKTLGPLEEKIRKIPCPVSSFVDLDTFCGHFWLQRIEIKPKHSGQVLFQKGCGLRAYVWCYRAIKDAQRLSGEQHHIQKNSQLWRV